MKRVDAPPAVVLVVGVNGAGKTTTIGKLAGAFQDEGRSVLLCAADTSGPPQSSSSRYGAHEPASDVIRQQQGSDPSSVVYTALERRVRAKSTT